MSRRVICVIAHPDDEITMGGTLAVLADAGDEITIVCATDGGGGVGSTDVGPEVLAALRRDELRAAAAILGVAHVIFFEPDHGLASGHLSRGNYGQVMDVHRLVLEALLASAPPDLVLTFGPQGITGHQTHGMVGALTDIAVAAAAPQAEVFHVEFSRQQADALHAWLRSQPDVAGAFADETAAQGNLGKAVPDLYPAEDSAIDWSVDVTQVMERKLAAAAAHAHQGGGGNVLQGFVVQNPEHFVRHVPTR